MDTNALALFRRLCETPTPSGWETPGQRLLAEYVRPYAHSVRLDVHGNLHAVVNPDAPVRIMLDGHCDEIGLLVQHVDNEGFLYMAAIGGVNIQLLPGERLVLQGCNGPVRGVVGAKAIHLVEAKDRDRGVSKITDLWVDIGAKSRQEALDAVPIGAPATVETGWRELLGDRVAARAMDDRVGAFVVMDALRRLAGRPLNVAVHVVSSTQEELGLLGAQVAAFDIAPHAGIAVDVTFASDDPGKDEKQVGQVKLGGGPVLACGPTYDRTLNKLIEREASATGVPLQPQARARGNSTNAFAIRMARSGGAVALLSVPLRYMHTPVETLSLSDVEQTSQLLADTLAQLPADVAFGPTL